MRDMIEIVGTGSKSAPRMFDPFTGKPNLAKTAEGFTTVYSVSDDLKDNGGKLWREKSETRATGVDLGFKIIK